MNPQFFYGYIYLLESNGLYKIGYSFQPKARLKRLQTGSPTPIRLVHTIRTAHYKMVEQQLHNQFADKRLRGEWFALTQDDVDRILSMDRWGKTPEENAERAERDKAWEERPRSSQELREAAEFNSAMGSLFRAIARDVPSEPTIKQVYQIDSLET